MKLTCDACKLTLNARDSDKGKAFTCPICRGPLRDAEGAQLAAGEQPAKPAGPVLEWSGGSLDDLLYMVNSQALAGIVEINAPDKKGEVHVIAGGIDEAYAGDKRGDEAMDSLRSHDDARFRVELRLPNEQSGSLASPGADRGELKSRPLARLMRYSEEYVLTCDLEVWRGTEACRVEYRRGNIARTLVNGIDAPEQLGEIMGWTVGNYRFVLPRLALPAAADEATRAQARAAAETRIAEQKARKTIFGMPASALTGAAAGPPASEAPMAAAPPPSTHAPEPMAQAAMAPSGAQTMMMGAPAGLESASVAAASAPAAAPARAGAATILGMPAVASAPAAQPQGERANASSAAPSVVIDSAYAAAVTPSPAGKDGRDGHDGAAADRAAGAAKEDRRAAKTAEKQKERAVEQPEKSKARPVADRTSARKETPAVPAKGGSVWINVGIAAAVFAAVVICYIVMYMFSQH